MNKTKWYSISDGFWKNVYFNVGLVSLLLFPLMLKIDNDMYDALPWYCEPVIMVIGFAECGFGVTLLYGIYNAMKKFFLKTLEDMYND